MHNTYHLKPPFAILFIDVIREMVMIVHSWGLVGHTITRNSKPLKLSSTNPITLANLSFATTITLVSSIITSAAMTTTTTTSIMGGSCMTPVLRSATACRIVLFVLRRTTSCRGVLTTLINASSCYWIVTLSLRCATNRLWVNDCCVS